MSDYGFTISVNNLASAKMKEIEASLASMGVKAEVETKHVSEHFELMGEKMGETFKNLKGLLLTGLGITALFEGWEFIEKSKEAFEGLEKAVVKVDTVLKSTKFAAGFSSDDIQDQAKEISKTIVAKRDEILDAQGMLLSFHSIRGNTFKETTSVVADFAQFYKENMTQAALEVGKAVNDPLKGYSRLIRKGVEFTPIQIQQIKNYEKQGKLLQAQAIILGELKTEFGGQAAAFALTDAGKIQMAAKQWEELQFKIGEIVSKVEVSLIPSFTKIVNSIKDAFNSSIIQFFIEHIKDLVTVVLKLIPIWLAYKAVMMANAAITSLFSIENGILTASMGSLTVMTDGSTLAFEGFSAAIASTGIGALVVGLGLLIEKFISINSEIDTTVEKLSGITAIKDALNQSQEAVEKSNLAFSNINSLNNNQKSALSSDIANQIKDIKDKIALSVTPQLGKTQAEINKAKSEVKNDSSSAFSAYLGINEPRGKLTGLMSSLSENKKALETYTKTLADLLSKKKILDAMGIKPLGYTNAGSDGVKASSINTSNLSGASGGLGQAKEIKIFFNGPFQQNNGVKESKAESDKAIEKMIEMLNGFTSSENAQ